MFQSHHQWFLPPTIGIRAPFVGKQKCFGVYPNFQNCQKQVLIIPQCRAHQEELTAAKISQIGVQGSPHAPPEYSARSPTRIPRAPRLKTTEPHARHIGAAPSRLRRSLAEPQAESSRASSRSVLRAEPSRVLAEPKEYSPEYSPEYSLNIPRIFHRIFPVQPSEPPAVQNWLFDRFTHFLTRFQQSQTGSRLFGPFRIDLQCPFGQIRLPKGDIVIKREK